MHDRPLSLRAMLAVAGSVCILSTLSGCGGNASRGTGEPLADLRNPNLDTRVRVDAVARASTMAGEQPEVAPALRATLKDLAWAPTQPVALRYAALEALLNSPDAAVVADAREMGKLILPREGSRDIVVLLSKTAADKGWTDYIPSLVRSYSRPLPPRIDDTTRAERLALEELSAGRPLTEVIFDVFLAPPQVPASYGLDWSTRFRTDAWSALNRLDPSGEVRRGMLARVSPGDPLVDAIVAAERDLRTLPATGEELAWLRQLRDSSRAGNADWWSQTSAVISQIPADKGHFHIRHLEPLRWAAANRPQWLSASRDDLLAEVSRRLESRRRYDRSAEMQQMRVREDLDHSRDSLRWADLLSILVIDDALANAAVRSAIFAQVAMDRRDTTTEYGGLLAFGRDGSPVVVLFPPRPGQRRGDTEFVASDDMINASDRALAHYHFHVQRARNEEYAGPSSGDLEYAARMGRGCLVITSVEQDVLNVDYFQPDGVVLDLGLITP